MTTTPKRTAVVLTDNERKLLGLNLLGIADGERRRKVLHTLGGVLSICASELANAPNALLRSDFIAAIRPVMTKVKQLDAVLQSTESHVLFLVAYKKFVDLGKLSRELEGFTAYDAWLREEPSKKGAEQRAFQKQQKDRCKQSLGKWFEQHADWGGRLDEKKEQKKKKKFVRTAFDALERAAKASEEPSDTGNKRPL